MINKTMMLQTPKLATRILAGIVFIFFLAGCGNTRVDPDAYKTKDELEREENGSILNALGGLGGIRINGRNSGVSSNAKLAPTNSDGKSRGFFGLGGNSSSLEVVNENIWRAAYDLTSVLPVAAANRSRGVIETDWYAPPGITNEQMRVVVFVGSGPISPTAVKVNAYRRGFDAQGKVVQSNASTSVIDAFENAILVRARELENS